YWLDRFDIAGWKNRRISELSKGMQQKVQLVCCLISMPKLIFLDEPFSGIDPINFNLFTEIIKEYNKESGATIVLSTHNMKSVESICSEVAFMKEGKICTNGNIANVRKQFMRDHYYEIILSKSDGIRDGEVDWAMALGDSFRVDYVEYGYERVRLGVFAQNGTDAVETITELVKRMQGYDVIACGRNAPSMEEIFLQIGK
ncbi:MAG: ATP-binding cassette domain-containing protein, partial [Bacteroidales bacterium]|nr:ATP-binding cassette domain-containing protein [Bacteroidales bacterium]